MHHLDFPKVPIIPPEDPLKEVYVIRDEENPRAPVIWVENCGNKRQRIF